MFAHARIMWGWGWLFICWAWLNSCFKSALALPTLAFSVNKAASMYLLLPVLFLAVSVGVQGNPQTKKLLYDIWLSGHESFQVRAEET